MNNNLQEKIYQLIDRKTIPWQREMTHERALEFDGVIDELSRKIAEMVDSKS